MKSTIDSDDMEIAINDPEYVSDDPYYNYYVPGWKDDSYNIGDWIMFHHS